MDTIRLLQVFAREMKGRVIASGNNSVGFSMEGVLYKLTVDGDKVILHQLSGKERGKQAEVSTLSELASSQSNLEENSHARMF
jgi:hypothetical protein